MISALPTLIKEPGFRKEALSAFAKGMVFAGVLLLLLVGWVFMRADDTLASWQARFPSKTVMIQSPFSKEGLDASDMITPDEEHPPAQQINPEEAAFYRFKKATPLHPGQAHIAVVLSDIGISEKLSQTLIDGFPATVTLGMSPYAPTLSALKDGADEKGFESWLMLPMEPQHYPAADPGPMTVLSNASLENIHDRAERLMQIGENGYPGFISSPRHVFTQLDLRTNPLMRLLAEKGFGFAESRHQGNDFAKDYAEKSFMPYVRADEWLTRNSGRADIQTILQRTEKLAQLNGSAVLMVEVTPLSIDLLKEWLDKLPGRNIQLVSLSSLAK